MNPLTTQKILLQKCFIWIGKVLLYIIFLFFSIMAIYPIIWMLIRSVHSGYDTSQNIWPLDWTLENYFTVWHEGHFGPLVLNSVIYIVLAGGLALFFSSMAGFAFAKLKSKAKPLIYTSFIVGIILSIHSLMVPLTLIIRGMGLYDHPSGVILVYIGKILPIGVYLLTKYIRSIPHSLIELALLEGASYLYIFWKVILPMTRPMLLTYAILVALCLWNEFILINVLTSDPSIQSLPMGIFHFFHSTADYGQQLAALMIGTFPLILYFIIFRRQIIQGVCVHLPKE